MDISETINIVSEKESWEEFLLSQPKERLVELLIERMIRDANFSRKIYYQLTLSEKPIDQMVQKYELEVKSEVDRKAPDVDFLCVLSEQLMNRAESAISLLDRLKLYTSVVMSLDHAISQGAGYENEDEFALDELMDQCKDRMLRDLKGLNADLTAKEIGEIYNFLRDKSSDRLYYDGDERIECVFETFKTLTQGRARLLQNGAYVRGSEYYAKL